nr:MAG TPA: hypothetical protein [Caudoviricetes sp.]
MPAPTRSLKNYKAPREPSVSISQFYQPRDRKKAINFFN